MGLHDLTSEGRIANFVLALFAGVPGIGALWPCCATTSNMPSAATAASQPMYQKDEKTLCFHGELLYEAKVLEVRRIDSKDKTSPHEYRVHYKGWKNS